MRRRDFIKAIACSATIWPLAARAQQPKVVRLGYLKLTAPNGHQAHINVAQVTFIRADTQISGANAELGMASGKVHGVQESVDEIVQQITAGQRGGVPWIKLTEPNGNLIHINVAQVISVRADTQIPGAYAELSMTSGNIARCVPKVTAFAYLYVVVCVITPSIAIQRAPRSLSNDVELNLGYADYRRADRPLRLSAVQLRSLNRATKPARSNSKQEKPQLL